MSANWTIHNLTTGASGSVGDYFGFGDPVIDVANQEVSSLTLARSGSLDDPWQFQYEDRVVLLRDGVTWFVGTCLPGEMNGSPDSESASYRIVDDFYWLKNTVFRQRWVGNLSSATGGYWSGHLVLNYDAAVGWLTTRGQVQQVLNYATRTPTSGASAGCSLQFDWDASEFPDVVVWQEEVRNITLAEALQKQLRFFPQAALYFDYAAASATGRPRLHCSLYDDQPVVTIPLAASAGDSTHESVRVSRVWEQEVPAVHIIYEKTGTVTIGDETRSFLSVVEDIAPTASHGFEKGCVHSNVSLMGSTSTSLKQTIYTRPFDATAGDSGADSASANSARVAWWKRHVPALMDADTFYVSGVKLMQRGASGDWQPAASGYTALPYEMADGTWSDWMPIAGGSTTPSNCDEVGVSGTIHYTRKSEANGNVTGQGQGLPYFGAVNTTDVHGGEGGTPYTVQTSYEPDEPTPTGLAANVYNALKGPLYHGTVSYVAEECDALGGILKLGTKVCLDMRAATGGQDHSNPDYDLWRAMNMTVQRIRYELETGKTHVTFGPPKHLGIPDFVDLLRQGRFRQKIVNSKLLATGDMTQQSVQAGDKVFKALHAPGVGTPWITESVGPTTSKGTPSKLSSMGG